MYINLSGLNVLVTGASRGIGKAIAIKLAEAGASVAIHYNKSGREAENLTHLLGNDSKAFQADFTRKGEAGKLFDRVTMEMGSVEVLVNNAGIAKSVRMEAPEEEWFKVWSEVMQVNLNSTASLCRKAIVYFLERKTTGRIINIASRAAFKGGQSEYMAYAASKAGVVSLTKTIASSYGKNGIKAFGIAPGFVKTDMAKAFIDQYGEEYAFSDLTLERMTEPKDLAPLVTFIASGMADHCSGATFDVNAGSYMH